jgi:hypothetical protein
MSLEKTILTAYGESLNGVREGDKQGEMEEIRSYILAAQQICIPNRTGEKISAINTVLKRYGIRPGTHLQIHTSACDVSRMPALTKAMMALDVTDCDLVIARGRLGVPGSGSMLVILDNKGRILSASLSPPHVIHKKPVQVAVRDEMESALVRIGFTPTETRS